jgi:hypothetical protein
MGEAYRPYRLRYIGLLQVLFSNLCFMIGFIVTNRVDQIYFLFTSVLLRILRFGVIGFLSDVVKRGFLVRMV